MTDNLQGIQSYETLCAQNRPLRVSRDFLRLRWKPFGPIATSIHVANNSGDPLSARDQIYSQGAMGFHPISTLSLTEPPISSIAIAQFDLDNGEDEWVNCHLPHADYDGAVWAIGSQDVVEMDEDDRPIDDKAGLKLMRCCDEDRPRAQAPRLVVQASSKPYLTIHEYIAAVHALN